MRASGGRPAATAARFGSSEEILAAFPPQLRSPLLSFTLSIWGPFGITGLLSKLFPNIYGLLMGAAWRHASPFSRPLAGPLLTIEFPPFWASPAGAALRCPLSGSNNVSEHVGRPDRARELPLSEPWLERKPRPSFWRSSIKSIAISSCQSRKTALKATASTALCLFFLPRPVHSRRPSDGEANETSQGDKGSAL